MRTEQAKKQYKARASLVENVNARVKGRYGLTRLTVRGLEKVKNVAVLVALAHNLAAHGQHLVDALNARPGRAQPLGLSQESSATPGGNTGPVDMATTLLGGP